MPSNQPQRVVLAQFRPWKSELQICNSERSGHCLRQNLTIVNRHGKIAVLVELFPGQSRPLAIKLAAFDAAAEHEHDIRVPMVCSASSVLLGGAAKLTHRHQSDLLRIVAHIAPKGRDSFGEIPEPVGEVAIYGVFSAELRN